MNAPVRAFPGRSPVLAISLPYVFQLAAEMELLEQLPTDSAVPFREVFRPIFMAHHALDALRRASVFSPYLRSSRQFADDLYNALSAEVSREGSMEREVSQWTLWSIKSTYDRYKVALLAELGVFPAYFVTQKESFDTLTLLGDAATLFPADLPTKVPEAMFDVAEAAKHLHLSCRLLADFIFSEFWRPYYGATRHMLPTAPQHHKCAT